MPRWRKAGRHRETIAFFGMVVVVVAVLILVLPRLCAGEMVAMIVLFVSTGLLPGLAWSHTSSFIFVIS